jgi:hypothetical protein
MNPNYNFYLLAIPFNLILSVMEVILGVTALFSTLESHEGLIDDDMLRHNLLPWISIIYEDGHALTA